MGSMLSLAPKTVSCFKSLEIRSSKQLSSCCRSGQTRDRSSASAQRPVLRVRDAVKLAAQQAGQHLTGVSQVHMQTSASIMEQLIQEVASPRTHTILKDYYQQTEVRNCSWDGDNSV